MRYKNYRVHGNHRVRTLAERGKGKEEILNRGLPTKHRI